jgi:hypothetical protein
MMLAYFVLDRINVQKEMVIMGGDTTFAKSIPKLPNLGSVLPGPQAV